MSEWYNNYLLSPHWVELSRRIKQRDGGCCRVCGGSQRLEVHHRTYARVPGRELDTDLITLCHVCHEVFHTHGKLAKSPVHQKPPAVNSDTDSAETRLSPTSTVVEKEIPARAVPCPACKAEVGDPCRGSSGNVWAIHHHRERLELYEEECEREAIDERNQEMLEQWEYDRRWQSEAGNNNFDPYMMHVQRQRHRTRPKEEGVYEDADDTDGV